MATRPVGELADPSDSRFETVVVPSPVALRGVNDLVVTAWLMPESGRIAIASPFDGNLAASMRRLRARRARLVPRGTEVDPVRMLGTAPDGRLVLWQQAGDDRATARDAGEFVWTIPAARLADASHVYAAIWPAGGTQQLAELFNLHPDVRAAWRSDGAVAVNAAYDPEWITEFRVTGGRWDPVGRVWMFPPTQCSLNLADEYTGTHWRPALGLPPGSSWRPWTQINQPIDRTRLCIAAGLSPTEAIAYADVPDEILNGLAGLLGTA